MLSALYLPLVYAQGTQIVPADLVTEPAFAEDDNVTTQKIKQKITLDNRISATDIDIKTNEGIVVPRGVFNDMDEVDALIEDIISTSGVADIDVSEIVVPTGLTPAFYDRVITARIRGLYIREKIFADKPVTVMNIETRDGVVFLTGAVDNPAQQKMAIELAQRVPNVKKVVANIIIKL